MNLIVTDHNRSAKCTCMFICLFSVFRFAQKKLHEYCYFYETMVNGWHRFHSAMDDTKHIGFTRNGRAIRFVNRPNRPYENCYNFVKDRANIDLMDDQTAINDVSSTMKMMPSDTVTPSVRKSVSVELVPPPPPSPSPPPKVPASRKSLIPKRHINSNINPNNANNENKFNNKNTNNNKLNNYNTNHSTNNITNSNNNHNISSYANINSNINSPRNNYNLNVNSKRSNFNLNNNNISTSPHHRHRHHHHLSANHSHHHEHSQAQSLANGNPVPLPPNTPAQRKKHSALNHKKQNPLRKRQDQSQQTTLVRQMHSNLKNTDPDSVGVLKPLKRLNRKIVSTTPSSATAVVSFTTIGATRNPFLRRQHQHRHHNHHQPHPHHHHQQLTDFDHLKSEPQFGENQRHDAEIDVPKAHKSYQHHFDDYSNDEHHKWSNAYTPAVTKKSDILNTKKVTNQNSGIAAKFRHSHGKHMRRKNHLVTNQSEPMPINSK